MPAPTIKILLVGSLGTGKGQIGRAWGCTDADLPTLQPVILYERTVQVNDVTTRVVSWVLSYDAQFASLRRHFFDAANGIILTFRLADANQNTLDALDAYLLEIEREIGSRLPQVLVGVALKAGESSSPDYRQRIQEWVDNHNNLPFFEADFTHKIEFARVIDRAFFSLLSRL